MVVVDRSAELLSPQLREEFVPAVTYLNTATYGLMPLAVTDAVASAERQRASGEFDVPSVDDAVAACRRGFGELTGYDASQIAISAQVSQLIGLVASNLPAGARVVVPEVEFTSVIWPFLASEPRGVKVRSVPLADLVDAIQPGVDVVAASVVQSADGAVLDVPAVVGAAKECGARVLLDATQAAGWFPVHDTGADWVVGAGYKWLLGPKGTAFMGCSDAGAEMLQPVAAGWYAGYDPWETCYGGPLRLADDARRFDVSPVWPAWLGQVKALELVQSVGVEAIHRHNVGLANRLRSGLGLPDGSSAIVALDVAEQKVERLRSAGVVGSQRNGRLRLAFHLYNTGADVDLALDALT